MEIADMKNADNIPEDIKNEFSELIKKFKPPRRGRRKMPFILFGRRTVNSNRDGALEPAFHCLTTAHPVTDKIDQYLNKGWLIFDWWMPIKNDLPPELDGEAEHGWVAALRGGGEGEKLFRMAESHIRRRVGMDGAIANIISERDAEKAEKEALLEELQRLREEFHDKLQDREVQDTA